MINKRNLILSSFIALTLLTSGILSANLMTSSVFAQEEPFTLIGFAGDFTCDNNGDATVKQLADSNAEVVIALGDLSYVDSNINCFIANINNNNLEDKIRGVVGNHEARNEDGSSNSETQTKQLFKLDSKGYDSFTHPLGNTGKKIAFIQLYTQESIATGSDQYNWADQQAQAFQNDPTVKYIIFSSHKLLWDSNNACDHGTESYSDDIRNMMYKYSKVKAGIFGHDHCYMLSKPMVDGDTVTTNTNPNAKTFVLAGLGGRNDDTPRTPNAQTLEAFASPYGAAYFKIYHNIDRIDQYFQTNQGTVKAQHSILLPGVIEPPICPPGQHWDPVLLKCVPDQPPVCPPGYHWDPNTQSCVPDDIVIVCPDGYKYDPASNTCQPDIEPPVCPPGQHWDPEKQQCVPNVIIVCPGGYEYDPVSNTCQPDNKPPVPKFATNITTKFTNNTSIPKDFETEKDNITIYPKTNNTNITIIGEPKKIVIPEGFHNFTSKKIPKVEYLGSEAA